MTLGTSRKISKIEKRWWNRVLKRLGIHGHHTSHPLVQLENLEPRTLFNIIPLGAPIQADNGVPPITLASQVATDAVGDRVVVWSTSTNGTTFDGNLFFRLIDSTGAPITPVTQINPTIPANDMILAGGALHVDTEVAPQTPDYFDVAMDPGGDFVVVWQAANGIFAQRFTPTGGANGAPIQVSDGASSNNATAPTVAMDPAGDFAVSWLSDETVMVNVKTMTPATSSQQVVDYRVTTVSTPAATYIQPISYTSSAVFARRFDVTGAGGATIRVTPPAAAQPLALANTSFNSNISPSIAMDAGGDFVVAWDTVGYAVQKQTSDPGSSYTDPFYLPNQGGTGGHYVNLKTTQGPTFSYYMQPKTSTVLFQRFSAASAPAGVATKATSKTTPIASVDVQVAEDSGGDFAVVTNFGYDKSLQKTDANGDPYTIDQRSSAIRFKRFKPGGKTSGGDVLAVSSATIRGTVPPIASLATAMSHDGTLLLAWDRAQFDPVALTVMPQGVFTQRFDLKGKPLDIVSRAVAAPTVAGALNLPSVAYSGDTIDMSYRGGPLDVFVQNFRQPLPDLTLGLPQLTQVTSLIQTAFNIPLTITNSGGFTAKGPVTISLDFSTDDVFGNIDDVPIVLKVSMFNVNLAPGASTTVRLKGIMPADLPITTPGFLNFLIAHVTPGPAIVESNSNNNDAMTQLVISG